MQISPISNGPAEINLLRRDAAQWHPSWMAASGEQRDVHKKWLSRSIAGTTYWNEI
jgi:hypothetical protein